MYRLLPRTVPFNMLRLVVIVSFLACCLGAAPRIRRPGLDGRIVGGSDADIADYPYQLSYQLLGSHMCGASIISEDWAITAAHCSDGMISLLLSLRAGSSIRGQGGSVHGVSRVLVHEDYDYYTVANDVSVLKVSSKFNLGAGIAIIALASATPDTGTVLTITGWGATSEGGSSPRQLQVVQVPVVDHAECNAAYASYGGVTESMLCAGLPAGGKDACQGDSGGPLVANNQLVGLVSWGVGCAQPNYPGVNADVAVLRSWVTEKTGL